MIKEGKEKYLNGWQKASEEIPRRVYEILHSGRKETEIEIIIKATVDSVPTIEYRVVELEVQAFGN